MTKTQKLSSLQESGSAFLQGSLSDFGLMGTRTAKSGLQIKACTQTLCTFLLCVCACVRVGGGWNHSAHLNDYFFSLSTAPQLMCELGNGVINQIYEARREELGARKPQPGDPRYCDAAAGTLCFLASLGCCSHQRSKFCYAPCDDALFKLLAGHASVLSKGKLSFRRLIDFISLSISGLLIFQVLNLSGLFSVTGLNF